MDWHIRSFQWRFINKWTYNSTYADRNFPIDIIARIDQDLQQFINSHELSDILRDIHTS